MGFSATSVSPSSRAGACTIPKPGRAIHNGSVLVPKTVNRKQAMFSLMAARVQGPHRLIFDRDLQDCSPTAVLKVHLPDTNDAQKSETCICSALT